MTKYIISLCCSNCAVEFDRRRDRVLDGNNFCSMSCRKEWHTANVTRKRLRKCDVCESEYIPRQWQIDNGQGMYCSHKCGSTGSVPKGKKHHNWGGGKYINTKGYVCVLVSPKHYRLEHVLVMESHLGRPMKKDEDIHHINFDKTDNRIENLRVMSHRDHLRLHSCPMVKIANSPKALTLLDVGA